MLTAVQLADRFQIHVETLYTMVKEGRAPRALRVGARLRFRLHDVESWERFQEARPSKIHKVRMVS